MGSFVRTTPPKREASGSSAHELCSSSERKRHNIRAETLSRDAPVRWAQGPRCRCSRPPPVPRAAPLLGFLRPFSAIGSVSPFRRPTPRGPPPRRQPFAEPPLTPCLQGGHGFASPVTVPPSGSLTLVTVCSSPSLAGLFHPSSAPGVRCPDDRPPLPREHGAASSTGGRLPIVPPLRFRIGG